MPQSSVRLEFSDGRPPQAIDADPALFPAGAALKIGGAPFVVVGKELRIDAGAAVVVVRIRPARRWLAWLDAFAARHDSVIPVLGALLAFALCAAVALLFYGLGAAPALRLAWAGYAIDCAPAALCLGFLFGMPVLGVLLEKKIGALALSIGVTGGVLGFGLAMMWRALFIPAPPVAWPDDYAALAERFGQSAAAMTALAAGYAPALLLILKLLKFDTLETLAGALFSDKKGK